MSGLDSYSPHSEWESLKARYLYWFISFLGYFKSSVNIHSQTVFFKGIHIHVLLVTGVSLIFKDIDFRG